MNYGIHRLLFQQKFYREIRMMKNRISDVKINRSDEAVYSQNTEEPK